MIYRDGESGISYIKRFSVLGVTREKEYDLTKGSKGSKCLYFTANPNGEAELINVQLKPHSKLKKLQFDIDFADHVIKGRSSMGNIVTKYPVKKVLLKSKGVSTLSGRKIWFDETLKRLNVDSRGKYLGEFDGEDRILTVNQQGIYELSSFELSNHFDDHLTIIEKYNPEKVFSVIYLDGKAKTHYLKRFVFDNTAIGKKTCIISEEAGSKLFFISGHVKPKIKLEVLKGKTKIAEVSEIELAEAIEVKGMKAMGNRLSPHEVKNIEILQSPVEEEEDEIIIDQNDSSDGDSEESGLDEARPVSKLARDLEDSENESDSKQKLSEDSTSESPSKDLEKKPNFIPEVQVDSSKEPESASDAKSDEKDTIPEVITEVQVESAKEPEKPVKKVDFEITNPDDLDIDNQGQLGLF
jgi:topoisomerase-4 subunit A